MACSGLGTTRRGYEAFFESLNRRVQDVPDLDVRLYKGGGTSTGNQRRVWNLPRRSRSAVWIGERLGLGQAQLGRGYYVEQASFFAGLIPHLITWRPDLVYFSDKDLGDLLSRWRRVSGQRFRLLFRNGGPYPPPYPRFDYVQQLSEPLLQAALARGCPNEQQWLLPAGFDIAAAFSPLQPEQRRALRLRLELPPDGPLALAVGAMNASHKRLDYVIREVARLPQPRPRLLVLGQPDAETPGIVDLGRRLLGTDRFGHRTVSAERVTDYYRAADLFVLASLREGFGRVWVEALAQGLPCLAHDFPVARFVLGEHGSFGDFSRDGTLTALLAQTLLAQTRQTPEAARQAAARHRRVYERFSWDRLTGPYVDMFRTCARRQQHES